MKLFTGLATTDYQDLLRALGALIDTHGLRDVRLWEDEQGIILQGRRSGTGNDAYETLRLTDDDLQELLTRASRQRG